jgi:geranylgeranyl diphosphate synthase type I
LDGTDAPRRGVLADADPVARAVEAEVAGLGEELTRIDASLAPAAAMLADAASGGKGLRGALVRWSFVAHGGGVADDVTGAAVAVELVHLSALVHDDLIDRSDLRRGRPSVHVRAASEHPSPGSVEALEHGRDVAVLLGDVVLAAAGRPLRRCRVSPAALDAAHQAFVRLQVEVMAGQYLDVDAAARRSADPERALTIATLKSGRYSIARPLELGALLAGVAPDATAPLVAVGDALGLAFQLRDDLLGVFGDPEVTGKPAGSDLAEGKRTMLVAETLARLPRDARTVFDATLGTEADVEQLRATIERSGARAAVEDRIGTATATARDGIVTLPLPASWQQDLLELADWMTTRDR